MVELKQWSQCEPSGVPGTVRLGTEERLHPSVQAASYARYLRDVHEAFQDDAGTTHAAAYLHNLQPEHVGDFATDAGYGTVDVAPLFGAYQVPELVEYAKARVGEVPTTGWVERVLASRFRPSRTLLANVADSIDGHEPWQLLDEQLVVFNRIQADIESARRTGSRSMIVVRGGPGTGKSVIAVQVVGVAARRGRAVVHATGSKAFTTNLRGVVGAHADAIFRYSHHFRDAQPGELDLIVCDEAHRLRQRTQFGPRVYSNRPQADEIVDAAKVSVFLLDQQQSVRLNEVGTVEGLEQLGRSRGIPIHVYDLETQFRCAGSESYVRWIEYALELATEPSTAWHRNGEYEVRVYDDVREMEQAIRLRARDGHSARLVAGFCWPWSEPESDGALPLDVHIGEWRMPWNRKPPEMCRNRRTAPQPDRHPYTLWATRPEGIDEVGCIYSAQGFEFDYVGVIFGKDMAWDPAAGRWEPRLAHNKDPSFRRGLTQNRDLAVRQLAHVYRVLSTRGMSGTYFYFCDDATRARFNWLLNEARRSAD